MSELKVNKVTPRSGTTVTLGDSGDNVAIPTGVSFNGYGYRNIIINGDMSIAQRGTSATGLGDGDSGYHTCDRWRFSESGAPTYVFTQTQDTDVPTGQGFATSLKMDCTTAQGSLAAADVLRIEQRVEGQNLQYLKKGTSSAESLTVSFWVKSNKTGTYTCEIFDNDNNRQNSKTYTIDSANTWEKKIITYDGDTTGAFDNNNGTSFLISFFLGAGTEWTSGTFSNGTWNSSTNANRVSSSQVNLADNTANNFWITGIQLEAGTTASDFEFLPVDVNLNRCLRYYQIVGQGGNFSGSGGMITNGAAYSSSTAYGVLAFLTEMRTAPSLDQTTGTNYFRFQSNSTVYRFDSFSSASAGTRKTRINNGDSITASAGNAGWFGTDNAAAELALNAEL